MKLISYALVAGFAVALMFSCGTTDLSKKYPNMVANVDPLSVGTVEVEFDRLFSSKLNKVEVEVIFYPRLNAVALEFRHEFVRYRQFWDEAGRRQFAAALELYKADYEQRNLINRYNRTNAVYGKIKGRTEWETFKFSKVRIAYPAIGLGYRFRSESPFFATLMRSATEESDSAGGSDLVDSQQIAMYFTRAQADDLARLFDQAYLMGLLRIPANAEADTPSDDSSFQEYEEYQP